MGISKGIRARGWQNLATAKKLVKRYKKLPSTRWLKAHGYSRLYNWLHAHPEFLKLFPRDYDPHGYASTFNTRWQAATKAATKLRGKAVAIGRGHGTAIYTGKLTIVNASHKGIKNWVPEIRCLNCNSIVGRSEKSAFPTCSGCVTLSGGLESWSRHVITANNFGMTATEVMQKRKVHTNKDGLVCCAICGVSESEQRHSQDHDQRFTKRSGEGNRGLLCGACNMKVVPVAEKILIGEVNLPPQTDGFGWLLLTKAIKYVQHWDKKLKSPRAVKNHPKFTRRRIGAHNRWHIKGTVSRPARPRHDCALCKTVGLLKAA